MKNKKWKELPKYKEDLLADISQISNASISPKDVLYNDGIVVNGAPLALIEEPFDVTQISFSPSRLLSFGGKVNEEEKEQLKGAIKSSLEKFRESQLKYLQVLYSPNEKVQKILEDFESAVADKDMDLAEKLDRAKEYLESQNVPDIDINSVVFMPKGKVLKYAADDLGKYLKGIVQEFDSVFAKLGSFDPEERVSALETTLRAWEEACEEWETEERRRLSQLRPGLLARLSKSDISFAQNMRNLADSGFRSMTDFDTALGAFVVSGMFPPAALLFLLPIVAPAFLDLFFENLSRDRERKAKDQSVLIRDEMANLFANKSAGNAIMAKLALRLANGESPEKIFADINDIAKSTREIYVESNETAKKIFSKYSQNDTIYPKSAEHREISDEITKLAETVGKSLINEEVLKSASTVKESAKIEQEIAFSTKFSLIKSVKSGEEGKISFSISSKTKDDPFYLLKRKQATSYLSEYVNHLNEIRKISKEDGFGSTLLNKSDLISMSIRMIMLFGDKYGITPKKIGDQSGTSFVETGAIINAFRNLDVNNISNLEILEAISWDISARILPQEFISEFFNSPTGQDILDDAMTGKCELIQRHNHNLFNFLSSLLDKKPDNEHYKKFIGAVMFFSKLCETGDKDPGDFFEKCGYSRTTDKEVLRKEVFGFLKEFKELDVNSLEMTEVINTMSSIFNRTVSEPALEEIIVRHVDSQKEIEEEEMEVMR